MQLVANITYNLLMVNIRDYKETIKKWNIQKLRMEKARMANEGGTTERVEAIEERIKQIERESKIPKEFGKRNR